MTPRRASSVAVLGSTGSIGLSTLSVIARHPERFHVFALAANSDVDTMFLFKTATSPTILRFSELARNAEGGPRQEHDVSIDAPLFGAFVAGLLGDLLYWAARLRADAVTGRQTWRAIQALITPPDEPPPPRPTSEPPGESTPEAPPSDPADEEAESPTKSD